MKPVDHERLLDLVSEAALSPPLWTTVLEELTAGLGGRGAMLSRLNFRTGAGDAQFVRPDADEVRRAFGYYAAMNPLTIVQDPLDYRRTWAPRVLIDEEFLPKSELVRSEYYNDFMRPFGMHSGMFIRLALEDDNVFAISISRSEQHDRFRPEELAAVRRLHPHLLRAFNLGRKIAAARRVDESLADALNALSHGIVVVGPDGKVHHANGAAERLLARAGGLVISSRRLTASNPGEARRLHQLIAVAASADSELRDSGSMALGGSDQRLPLSVTVSPLRSARDSVLGGDACVMVAVIDPEDRADLDDARLRDLFGLSPAEIRVASAIFAGQSPKEAAASLGVSFFTVRGHLVRIFEKTNTNRQAQLVRVMARALQVL
jgi:DNA-binding CsgD family transcriptional regulator/PAS domain-containing protein